MFGLDLFVVLLALILKPSQSKLIMKDFCDIGVIASLGLGFFCAIGLLLPNANVMLSKLKGKTLHADVIELAEESVINHFNAKAVLIGIEELVI